MASGEIVTKLSLSWGHRPCVVNERKALFHMWCPNSGNMIVEYSSGMLDRVPLEKVVLLDSEEHFKEFWREF